jgi:hypothetical protein
LFNFEKTSIGTIGLGRLTGAIGLEDVGADGMTGATDIGGNRSMLGPIIWPGPGS